MSPELKLATLQNCVERAAGDSAFFSYSLDIYQRVNHYSDDDVAAQLDCDRYTLYVLALKPQPRPGDDEGCKYLASQLSLDYRKLRALIAKAHTATRGFRIEPPRS